MVAFMCSLYLIGDMKSFDLCASALHHFISVYSAVYYTTLYVYVYYMYMYMSMVDCVLLSMAVSIGICEP